MCKATLLALIFVSAGASIAIGQTANTPDAASGPKREKCRADAKGLRGMERLDAMQICMAEGRLDCVKKAVAQKVARTERRDFIKTCMTGASAKPAEPRKDDDKDDDDKS